MGASLVANTRALTQTRSRDTPVIVCNLTGGTHLPRTAPRHPKVPASHCAHISLSCRQLQRTAHRRLPVLDGTPGRHYNYFHRTKHMCAHTCQQIMSATNSTVTFTLLLLSLFNKISVFQREKKALSLHLLATPDRGLNLNLLQGIRTHEI